MISAPPSSRNRSPTFGALLRAGAARLRAASVADPQRDARWLLRDAAGLSAAGLSASERDPAPEDVAARFERLLAARAERRPLSHILGRRDVYGRAFRIDGRALDPRPESEALVDAALAHLEPTRPARVLDLGVGSGCLLLSVLAERAQTTGLGVDQSAEALALAAANAAALDAEDGPGWTPITPRLTLRQGDWLRGVDERFDLILCNPPYIDEAEWATLEPEVRCWEPKAALTPGPDGLAAYQQLAPKIGAHLAPGGLALFEIGREQGAAVAALFEAAGLKALLARDLGGAPRVIAARR